jgi:DNA repair exonuclease SbcCD nuclease subunit
MKKLTKSASFTDIHWGLRNNGEQHNQDCLEYINWFCSEAIKHNVDHINFLGDWFENRSAVNVSTLHYAYLGAKALNDLNIPVYFIVGNHDLYQKHTRDVYSTVFFNEFSNFVIINEPTTIADIETSPLICPYLFHDEYQLLANYKNTLVWWGHFEFQGFIITGNTIRMPSGPNPDDFSGPNHIFSGHFHKRQVSKNITYIGNTFPTTFSDADDIHRGMMIFDYMTQEPTFIDWTDCPTFIKTTLSAIVDNDIILKPKSRVKCLMDIQLNYEEIAALKQSLITQHDLREFTLEDESIENLTQFDESDEQHNKLEGINELIIRMLGEVDAPTIDNITLIQQYNLL